MRSRCGRVRAVCCSVYWRPWRVSSVAGGDALCATLYTGGVASFAGRDTLCAILYARGRGGWALFAEVLELLEVRRRLLLCMLEAVRDELCLLEVLEVSEVTELIRCVLLCTLEAVEGRLCLPEVMDALELLDAIRCVL